MVVEFNRKLILETGEEYCGYAFGAAADRVFDVIFNTCEFAEFCFDNNTVIVCVFHNLTCD